MITETLVFRNLKKKKLNDQQSGDYYNLLTRVRLAKSEALGKFSCHALLTMFGDIFIDIRKLTYFEFDKYQLIIISFLYGGNNILTGNRLDEYYFGIRHSVLPCDNRVLIS